MMMSCRDGRGTLTILSAVFTSLQAVAVHVDAVPIPHRYAAGQLSDATV